MKKQVSLVIFEGGLITGELELQMQTVRQAMVADLIERASLAGYERIVVVTSYPKLQIYLQALEAKVEVVVDQQVGKKPFHFGRRLQEITQQYELVKVLYMGGAAAPLISISELRYMKEMLEQNENILLANNYYSADIVGFTPATILNKVALPAIDNSLPLILANEGGLHWLPLLRSLGLSFDVDTPADILIMSVHPDLGPRTQKAVDQLQWNFSRYAKIKKLLGDPNGELIIYGRIGSNLFQYLDGHTRCRLRLYSEERGMKALGRDQRGEVRTLMGKLIEKLGYVSFFQYLAELAHGAVLDTRILFEHFHWELTSEDRFASDLGKVDLIAHPELKKFTRAAMEAPIPILLGGHSLVTGGIWALLDAGIKKAE